MRQFRIAPRAQRDLADIFRYSVDEFGQAASIRYRDLIAAAFQDIVENPNRNGVTLGRDLPASPFVYHLRLSRGRAAHVARPRHFVVFRVNGEMIEVIRVLHDAMDLAERLSKG